MLAVVIRVRRLEVLPALRLGLLATVAAIVQLTEPIFAVFGHAFSWRDLILIAGGLFLVWKATKEIHHNVDPHPADDFMDAGKAKGALADIGKAAVGMTLVIGAAKALDAWRHTTGPARAEHLHKWAAAIGARHEEIAQALTREVGKPIAERMIPE